MSKHIEHPDVQLHPNTLTPDRSRVFLNLATNHRKTKRNNTDDLDGSPDGGSERGRTILEGRSTAVLSAAKGVREADEHPYL